MYYRRILRSIKARLRTAEDRWEEREKTITSPNFQPIENGRKTCSNSPESKDIFIFSIALT